MFHSFNRALTEHNKSFFSPHLFTKWCVVFCVSADFMFVAFVVSLNTRCNTDEAHCSTLCPCHSCSAAPPTLILCNVLQEDPPLPWAIPCGTHLHYKPRTGRSLFEVKRLLWNLILYGRLLSVCLIFNDARKKRHRDGIFRRDTHITCTSNFSAAVVVWGWPLTLLFLNKEHDGLNGRIVKQFVS